MNFQQLYVFIYFFSVRIYSNCEYSKHLSTKECRVCDCHRNVCLIVIRGWETASGTGARARRPQRPSGRGWRKRSGSGAYPFHKNIAFSTVLYLLRGLQYRAVLKTTSRNRIAKFQQQQIKIEKILSVNCQLKILGKCRKMTELLILEIFCGRTPVSGWRLQKWRLAALCEPQRSRRNFLRYLT